MLHISCNMGTWALLECMPSALGHCTPLGYQAYISGKPSCPYYNYKTYFQGVGGAPATNYLVERYSDSDGSLLNLFTTWMTGGSVLLLYVSLSNVLSAFHYTSMHSTAYECLQYVIYLSCIYGSEVMKCAGVPGAIVARHTLSYYQSKCFDTSEGVKD